MFEEIDLKEFKTTIKSTKPILIDFYGTHCPQCRILSPILKELSDEMEGKVDFYKFDVNICLDIAKEYDIKSLPTLILFKEGKVLGIKIGSTSKKIIKDWINEKI